MCRWNQDQHQDPSSHQGFGMLGQPAKTKFIFKIKEHLANNGEYIIHPKHSVQLILETKIQEQNCVLILKFG